MYRSSSRILANAMFEKYLVAGCLLIVLYFSTNCSSYQTQNTQSEGWYGWGCPPRATGQFPYVADCKKFYNCYNGRGQLSICAPGTLFNPSTLECDFPSKVKCLKDEGKVNGNGGLVNAKISYPPHNHHQYYHHHHHSPHNSQVNENGGFVNAKTSYPPHNHHHLHHQYHHHHHSPHNSQDGSEAASVHWSAGQHQTQQHSWQYHHGSQQSSVLSQPENGTVSKNNEGFQTRGYHAGVQPPQMVPSGHLQPPPPEPPVYITNSKPVWLAIPINESDKKFHGSFSPALPALSPSSVQETSTSNQYSSRGHYAPPPSISNNNQYGPPPPEPPVYIVNPAKPTIDSNRQFHGSFAPALPALSPSTNNQYSSQGHHSPPPYISNNNQYQPSAPRQIFHTKTYSQTNANGQTLDTSYIHRQGSELSSSQGSTGYRPIIFPDRNKDEAIPDPNQNQDFSGYENNYEKGAEKITFSNSNSNPHVPPIEDPSFTVDKTPKDVCPEGFSGLTAHSDCTKFLSCSHGRTFVMNCSPGTRFNPELLICDHKYAVTTCGAHNVDSQTFIEDDNIQPAETNHEENIYRSAEPNSEIAGRNQVPEIESIENVTVSLKTYSKVSHTFEEVTTQSSHVTAPLIPGIKIKTVNTNETVTRHQQVNITNTKQSFKPENLPTIKARLISKRNSTLDKQILRLRGSPSIFEGFVEMQLSPGSWGLVCDKQNEWKIEEAHVVCKSLGYPRGAELTWQGLPTNVKNTTSTVLATDSITCTGSEDSFLDCTFSVGNGCNPNKDGVWVRCYSHGLSKCYPGEMSLGDRCYSLVVPDEESSTENLVGFTQGEALSHCQKKGGQLVDITSQVENDFISEWLIRQNIEGSIMTSGVGMSLMGGSIWIWEGSESTFTYHNWWPGWNSAKSIPPQTYTNRALCIVLRRNFPCQESKGTEDRLCDAQYYYWDVEDCDAMSTSLPYVCERPANKIGCVVGTGAGYKGAANVTKAGSICLSWDHNDVLQELKYRISESDRKVSLSGHNYCRNIAGKENHPWCFVRESTTLIKKELCDIPICSEGLEKSARYFQCPSNHFSCGTSGKCIPMSQVCDGNSDCSNSEDESNCHIVSSQFTLFENSKLIAADVGFFNTALTACAQSCLELANCRSFSFLVDEEKCILSELNIGLSGNLTRAPGWNYYEVKSKSIKCDSSFVCDNGKCISHETVCNGKNDCGDRSDEKNCSWLKQKIQIKLSGGNKPNEGTIEVKAHDRWGLVCDDEFDLKDGDVVCRHLGYPLGAAEIRKHSSFNHDHSMSFIIDNLNCIGNETSIADCFHNGWGIHDCQAEECFKAAGVVCKVSKHECSFNYWQCEKSAECIPLAFLCDNVKDCKDNSDEDPERCNSPIQVRLVGIGGVSRSNKANEGRVEVRRFGVWGTVCDDDFGTQEAKVVCAALGYNDSAEVYKEAAYGAGEGIIWLDQVHCLGNESGIHQCMSDGWGQTNCKHNEDVAVSCYKNYGNREKGMTKPTSSKTHLRENTIEMEEDDILLEDIFLPDCGVAFDLELAKSQASARVVAGFETVKGAYPWQASIRLKGIAGKSTHWCGAVVVSRFHVLTAGHCLRDYAKSAYFIRAGDYDNEVDEGTEQDMEIEEMWIHSGFDKGLKLNNDIALVKIKGSGFEFNNWVLPACLPQKKHLIPDNCTISGWGSSANPGTGFARTLHATWLQPIPLEECKSIDAYSTSLGAGMLCAGNLKGGPDSCQGDSGGPLLCSVHSQFTLFGITSWGHGCGRTNSPGVYTNVPHYIDWINDRIKVSMKKHKYRKD